VASESNWQCSAWARSGRTDGAARMRLLHDYLVGLPEERLVIVTDSEDVIPVPSTTPQEVQLRYAELVQLYRGPRVFFAAERYAIRSHISG